MPENVGSGVAFIDFDGDGWQDLLLVNGRDWTEQEVQQYLAGTGKGRAALIPANRPHRHSTCALYHNNGNGTFTDVTAGSGLDVSMYGMGAAVGDYDNDGRPDLYVTGLGRNYLFHNESVGGKPKFRDVSLQAGVADSGWSTSACWADYDRDGRLDLFVCHYIQWTPATDVFASRDGKLKSYVGPVSYKPGASRLYHNAGGGHFVDVTDRSGINRQPLMSGAAQAIPNKALGIAICDYNHDGWPDLFVTDDTVPNQLYRNNKNGTFTNVAAEVGVAYNQMGQARAGMGVDIADIDNSGRPTAVVGNFADEMLALFHEQKDGQFVDLAPQDAIGRASLKFLTFGLSFLDMDNDGLLDLFALNGHVDKEVEQGRRDVTYAERPLLFHNEGSLRFREVGLQSGAAMSKPLVGRGLAYTDYDLDGDVDIALTTNGGPAILLRNDGGNLLNSLRLTLQGTRSNRSAIGAVIKATVGRVTMTRTVHSGSSYLSQSELPVTLGLGSHSSVNLIAVNWPSGGTSTFKNIAANQMLVIDESKGIVQRHPFPHRGPPKRSRG